MKRLRVLARSSVRDPIIAGLLAATFLATGSCTPPGIANIVAAAPFDLDVSLRALAQGWYATDRTIPVTIVDIDEATHAGWGRPSATPRAELARLIETVAASRPRAIIVDIDVSWGNASAPLDSGNVAFRRFLEQYRGPAPLIFPKRLVKDSAERIVPAAGDLDDLIGTRPHLRWANAVFETGAGGAVREWEEWKPVCDRNRARRLPAVAAVVLAGGDSLDTLSAGGPSAACAEPTPPTRHRLLLGPPMTGPARVPTLQVQAVRAGVLLDPAVRIDPRIFDGRIVLIGSTHDNAGDLWFTPRGVVPGVELIASTIHYWPLSADDRFVDTVGFRIVVVLVFLGLAFATWSLTGIVTVFAVIAGMLLLTSIIVGVFDWFWFFDAAAAALVLIVGYEASRAVADFVVRVIEKFNDPTAHKTGGTTTMRFLRATMRASRRDPEPSTEGT